jgi:hypothetical protein
MFASKRSNSSFPSREVNCNRLIVLGNNLLPPFFLAPYRPFFYLSEMIDNTLNLLICPVKVNCQIRKFKITKLKQELLY